MRNRHVCPKCEHNRILLIAEVPDADGDGGRSQLVARAFAGVGVFGGDKTRAVGHLRACVCRRCGYTELYVDAPETIPVDGKYVTERVGPEPSGAPYR